MKFPNIYEVATTDVVKLDVSATLNDAIDTIWEIKCYLEFQIYY